MDSKLSAQCVVNAGPAFARSIDLYVVWPSERYDLLDKPKGLHEEPALSLGVRSPQNCFPIATRENIREHDQSIVTAKQP